MASLICMFGPLKNNRYTIAGEMTLGRDRNNALCIPDLLLSRKHCSITKEAAIFTIRDLHSRNGVRVNGIPVHERILQQGDLIEIGSSTFVFLEKEDALSNLGTPADIELPTPATTISLKASESPYLNSSAATDASKGATLLLDVHRALSAAHTLPSFYESVFDLMRKSVGFDRMFMLDASSLQVVASRTDPKLRQPLISRKICERAIAQKAAILARDFSGSGSLSGTEVQAVICVPFVWLNAVSGVVYMDTFDPMRAMQENHLQIASAISGLASPLLHYIQESQKLQKENQELRTKVFGDRAFIGESPAIRRIQDMIARIAVSDSTVLIVGESGTGKELAARSIHASSNRRTGPFVAINCAALPDSLLESELFGYEKGAFTGALNQKKGRIEMAEGGTLFLDEIGELSPVLQAKLLRVLQEREVERVGGTRSIPLDIRVIAATNQDLGKSIEEGKFRKDLFFRLNVVTLEMPPLRVLGDDVLLLAQHFVSDLAKKIGRRVHGLSPEVKEIFLRYDWPGNVRELQNAIERAIVLGITDSIVPDSLPEHLLEIKARASHGASASYHDAVLNAKKDLVLKAFEGTKGNYNEAAARLGLHPTHLYRLVKNLNLKDQIG